MTTATEANIVHESRRMPKILEESHQAFLYFDEHYDEWLADFPNEWAAASKDGLIDHHEDLEQLIVLFKEAGYDNHQVVVRFLDTEPKGLIL